MNYMKKACAGLKQEMSVTKHIFVSRLWMVMSQSVQGVACNKELQRANKSGTFVNSSNGTYFSPRSLSDRLSRRNDGLIPAWTSQVMVYVKPYKTKSLHGESSSGNIFLLSICKEYTMTYPPAIEKALAYLQEKTLFPFTGNRYCTKYYGGAVLRYRRQYWQALQ